MRLRHLILLAVLPFVLSGCSVLDTLTGGSSTSGGASSAAGKPNPSSTPWISVTAGSATPSPGPSRPTASVSPTVLGGFLPLPSAGVPYPTPSATCADATYNFAHINALTVKPSTTSATATWYNLGGYNLVEFRMTAISQDVHFGTQRDIGFVVIKPTSPCGQVSATITGLDRTTDYIFSVDAVVIRRSGDGTHAATVFRSGPTWTL